MMDVRSVTVRVVCRRLAVAEAKTQEKENVPCQILGDYVNNYPGVNEISRLTPWDGSNQSRIWRRGPTSMHLGLIEISRL